MTDKRKRDIPAMVGAIRSAHLSLSQAKAFALIEAAANTGAPCPTNAVIGDALGITESAGSCVVSGLKRKGLINVVRHGQSRYIEVIATGKRTAVPDVLRRHQSPIGKRVESNVVELLRRFVDPFPCERCGVRVGCGCASRVIARAGARW